MRKSYRYFAMLLAALICTLGAFAQTVITGSVRNGSSKETVPAVSVTIKGSSIGTFTDSKGDFKLTTNQKPPFTLVISSVGFDSKEVTVNSAGFVEPIDLTPSATLGTEVVVSASRVPERILESPVSIERLSPVALRNTPNPNYYDAIRTLKGVDMTLSSLTFNSVSTRGFNGSGNTRVNQLMDGMDNQAPGLNFSVGSVIGLTELDVDNVELLPGASSALYGPGGMNGTVLISSKNPFKYQGFSAQIKTGVMHVDSRQRNSPSPYYDWSFRWGKNFNDKFAFKAGAQFIHAKDWVGDDYRNYDRNGGNVYGNLKPGGGTVTSDPNYNGVNVYGDETSQSMTGISLTVQNTINSQVLGATGGTVNLVSLMNASLPPNATPAQYQAFVGSLPAALQPAASQMIPFYDGVRNNLYGTQFVSRTGYKENEVVNNNTVNVKLSGGLYYKITPKIEASLTANWGTGNTVYTGSDRYSLLDLKIGQYKAELRSDNWYLKAYTTQENAGQSYNVTVTTQLFNEAWKPSTTWYPEYISAYWTATRVNGADPLVAHNAARGFSDRTRPAAGTQQFRTLYDQIRSKPIVNGGGLFLDKSDLYHAEGQYNFKQIKFADVIVGGNWRQYNLNSQGTLFADTAGRIKINELGAYLQVTKRLFNDVLKLNFAVRYDKNENFKGRFTPRLSAVVKVAKDHNIRASFQTAYRFPSTQNQWINLQTPFAKLIGGLPELRDFYNFGTNPVYTQASVQQFAQTGNPALLKTQSFNEFKPESVFSYELGYKGLINKRLLIDAYAYFTEYQDFLGRIVVIQSPTGTIPGLAQVSARNIYSVSVNNTNKVNTYGWGFSADYLLPKGYQIGVNLSGDKIDNPDPNFITFFNSPALRTNVTFSNNGLGAKKRVGFSVNYRYQDGFYFQSDFTQGEIPAFSTVDAQVSYKLPSTRSVVRLGGTNIFNKYYQTAFGNPQIGGIYYVSFGFNVF